MSNMQMGASHRQCMYCNEPFRFYDYRNWVCPDCRKDMKSRDRKEKWTWRLSFFVFPLGVLLYLSWRKKNPPLAKVALKGASIPIIVFTALYILAQTWQP